MPDKLTISTYKGPEVIPFIASLAHLRIHVFKDYPYLYEGDFEYEQKYLNTYVQCQESIMVIVQADNHVVGASSAIPLHFETTAFQQPFLDQNIALDTVFYFGESVLLPEYRGQGVYRHFFQQREAAAIDYGASLTAFAAIERAIDDPRKPKDYLPLDNVWHKFGYQKNPALCAYLAWPEVGESIATQKPLIFWLKKL